MTSVNKVLAVLAALVVAIAAYIMRKVNRKPKGREVPAPPKNKAADKAIDSVQESFQEEVDRIKSATTSDSPADDLADLGNARKRR